MVLRHAWICEKERLGIYLSNQNEDCPAHSGENSVVLGLVGQKPYLWSGLTGAKNIEHLFDFSDKHLLGQRLFSSTSKNSNIMQHRHCEVVGTVGQPWLP